MYTLAQIDNLPQARHVADLDAPTLTCWEGPRPSTVARVGVTHYHGLGGGVKEDVRELRKVETAILSKFSPKTTLRKETILKSTNRKVYENSVSIKRHLRTNTENE